MAADRTSKMQLVRETDMIKTFGVASGRWAPFECEAQAQQCDLIAERARRRGDPHSLANAEWWAEGARAWRRLAQGGSAPGEASGV